MCDRTDEMLIGEYQSNRDIALRNTIVEKYAYIARIIAKKFAGGIAEFDDLQQVGMLAIIKAVERFEPEKKIKLSTYLTHCVSGEIKNYFRDSTDLMKVSRDIQKLKKQIYQTLSHANGASMSAEQIAAALNVSVEKVIEAMEYNRVNVALDSPVGSEDESLPLYETIADEDNSYDSVDNRDFFDRAMTHLSENEQRLITCRFVRRLSQSETAKELGVSQMLVSRLERKILLKLREYV